MLEGEDAVMVVLCNVPLVRAEGGEKEQEAKVEHLVVKILTLTNIHLEDFLDAVVNSLRGNFIRGSRILQMTILSPAQKAG